MPGVQVCRWAGRRVYVRMMYVRTDCTFVGTSRSGNAREVRYV